MPDHPTNVGHVHLKVRDVGRAVEFYSEVDDRDALQAVYERLGERGVAVSPVDHGISKAVYFDDPDGNGLEVYLDTREERDRDEWRGHTEPFDPATL